MGDHSNKETSETNLETGRFKFPLQILILSEIGEIKCRSTALCFDSPSTYSCIRLSYSIFYEPLVLFQLESAGEVIK